MAKKKIGDELLVLASKVLASELKSLSKPKQRTEVLQLKQRHQDARDIAIAAITDARRAHRDAHRRGTKPPPIAGAKRALAALREDMRDGLARLIACVVATQVAHLRDSRAIVKRLYEIDQSPVSAEAEGTTWMWEIAHRFAKEAAEAGEGGFGARDVCYMAVIAPVVAFLGPMADHAAGRPFSPLAHHEARGALLFYLLVGIDSKEKTPQRLAVLTLAALGFTHAEIRRATGIEGAWVRRLTKPARGNVLGLSL